MGLGHSRTPHAMVVFRLLDSTAVKVSISILKIFKGCILWQNYGTNYVLDQFDPAYSTEKYFFSNVLS